MDIYTDREIADNLKSKFGMSRDDYKTLTKTNPRLLRKLLRDDLAVESDDLAPRPYDPKKFTPPLLNALAGGIADSVNKEVGDSFGQGVWAGLGAAEGSGLDAFANHVDNAVDYGFMKGLVTAPAKYLSDQRDARNTAKRYNDLMKRLYKKLYDESGEK